MTLDRTPTLSTTDEQILDFSDDGAEFKARIIEYLQKAAPSIEGQEGRKKLYHVVRYLIDCKVSVDEAVSLLMVHFNPRCQGPWDERDIRRECEKAAKEGPSSSSSSGRAAKAPPADLNPDLCHKVYSAILGALSLKKRDKDAILARGFSEVEIEKAQYKSNDLGQLADGLNHAIAEVGDRIYEVPGIVLDAAGPSWTCQTKEGKPTQAQLVPVRDSTGRIVGIRYRVQFAKVSQSGTPYTEKKYLWISRSEAFPNAVQRPACVHVPTFVHGVTSSGTIWITEGEYKADFATLRRGVPTISIPGVGSWALGLDMAQHMRGTAIVVCLDPEQETNKGVAHAIISLCDEGSKRSLDVSVETWPLEVNGEETKGIDDLIYAGHLDQVQTLKGEELDRWLDRVAKLHRIARDVSPTAEEAMGALDDGDDVAKILAGSEPANEVAPEAKAPEGKDDWKSKLLRYRGKPKSNTANVRLVLENWGAMAGRIAYDEFRQLVVWSGPAPWVSTYPETAKVTRGTPWSDQDTTRLIDALNRLGIDAGKETVRDVIQVVAMRHTYHPVREYLDSLTWDGESRLGSWLTTHLGVPETEYSEKVGRWWPIQAVRRIYEPGASAKYILTLEGNQDVGKSTALKRLCSSAWFSESRLDIGSLAGQLGLKGIWIWELAEGAILTKADKAELKQYIGQTHDDYTPKWSNQPIKVLRQTVFAMSINPDGQGYLTDPTGNVRFWPVHVTHVDFDAIDRDRDQIWAEAVAMYRAGEVPEPRSASDKALLGEIVADRVQQDAWHEMIEDWCRDKPQVTVGEILTTLFEIKPQAQEHRDQTRVAKILKQIGFDQVPGRPLRDGKRVRLYSRADVAARPPLHLTSLEEEAAETLRRAGWVMTVQPDGSQVLQKPAVTEEEERLAEVISILSAI